MSEKDVRELNMLEIISEERLDLKFFLALQAQGNRELIQWCMQKRLMHTMLICPKCGKTMKLTEVRKGDGFLWECRSRTSQNPHFVNISVRKNSIFKNVHMPLPVIILMTVMWINGATSDFIYTELNISQTTVSDWIRNCRELCIDMCVRDSEKIGGVVEIDVSELGERKFKKGSKVHGKYVISGINSVENKFFVKLVEDRTSDSLLEVLKEFVMPGSVIVSDCWNSEECFVHSGFVKFSKSHSVSFKDPPLKDEFGNEVEGSWRKIEGLLSKTRHVENLFDCYKAEFLWRKNTEHNSHRQRVQSFFDMSTIDNLFSENDHTYSTVL